MAGDAQPPALQRAELAERALRAVEPVETRLAFLEEISRPGRGGQAPVLAQERREAHLFLQRAGGAAHGGLGAAQLACGLRGRAAAHHLDAGGDLPDREGRPIILIHGVTVFWRRIYTACPVKFISRPFDTGERRVIDSFATIC